MIKKKRLLSLLLAGVLCLGMVQPVRADEVADAKKKQEALEEEKKKAEQEQAELSQELDSIMEKMQKTQQDLSDKEQEINVAETDLVEAKAKENDQYESMKLRIKYMYENNNTELIEILVTSKSMSELLNKIEYIQQVTEYDRNMLKEFQKIREDIEKKEEALKEEYAQLETLRDQLQNEQTEMQALLDEKNIQIDNLSSEISANADELKKLIAEAKAAEERRKQQNQSNVYQPNNGNSQIVITGNGKLSHPVPGAYITSGFGYRVAPTAGATSRHDGIDYGASTGTPIYAADSGTVITAQYNSARGYYVVINHGNGMQTWYQHCSALYVSVGDKVSRGQNIAAVGATGIVTGPHLHCEVHVNGTPVDPLLYL